MEIKIDKIKNRIKYYKNKNYINKKIKLNIIIVKLD